MQRPSKQSKYFGSTSSFRKAFRGWLNVWNLNWRGPYSGEWEALTCMHVAFLSRCSGGLRTFVVDVSFCRCLLGWLCAFNHISDFCFFYPPNPGLFLLYVCQINFAKEQFKDTKKEWVLLVCIGASSGVGRLTFGKIGDLIPGLNKIYMQVRDATNMRADTLFRDWNWSPFVLIVLQWVFLCVSLRVIVHEAADKQ